MPVRRLVPALGATVALAIGLAACGSSGTKGTSTGSTSLTVYSSLPLRGPTAAQSRSIVDAEKLALLEAGGKVGPLFVKYSGLDDSGASGRWDPGAVRNNARAAIQDRTTIAYIGEPDSGAAAVAIPVLNQSGILTISPGATYPGLTISRDADMGEPQRYYPSRQRTFGRLVPTDDLQATAQIALQRRAGCRSLYVLDDRDVYGRGIAAAVLNRASKQGVKALGSSMYDPTDATAFTKVARKVKSKAPGCVFVGATAEEASAPLFDALNAALPDARLFGPDALASDAFAKGLSPATAARTELTTIGVDPLRATADARAFVRRFEARFGVAPQRAALYGYEAMRAVLQAIRDAGGKGNDRAAVIKAFFGLRKANSVLGPFSIAPSGDISGPDVKFGVAKVTAGRVRPLGPAPSATR